MRDLEFGWFLPTNGDTLDYAHPQATPPSNALFDRVMQAAEAAGFEYMLVPVAATCWEALITSAMMIGRTSKIKMLVAARPGYTNPVLLAKMISAFDQLSGGRIAINLIAGQNELEAVAEGIRWNKEARYDLMAEEVAIMKALWAARGATIDYEGSFYKIKGASIQPTTLQRPHPKFYLGGGSQQAWEMSAMHSDVHLFWGDTVETIADNMKTIRAMAAKHGRGDDIGFGMRLQILCREREEDAWDVAHGLIKNVTKAHKDFIRTQYANSAANQRVQKLARDYGELIAPHMWTGLTQARPGAGIVIVGNPEQCADTLQQFIDIGCHSFCLSGYLHDEEAERFARLVRPILVDRNKGRMLEIA